ncbi:MAG: hypothetical protein FJ360_03105 [Thaumarchaeota archaeon]|nr:hypothetical protein [Nitrososphaerota archaeon]
MPANIKTIEELRQKMAGLSVDGEKLKKILELIDQFESEAKTKRGGKKLRKILLDVGTINVRAGSLLLDYSESCGLLSKMVL